MAAEVLTPSFGANTAVKIFLSETRDSKRRSFFEHFVSNLDRKVLQTAMRSTLVLFLVAALSTIPALAQAPALPAGSAQFRLVQASNGKTLGSAGCSVASGPNGYQVDSRGQMQLEKFSYRFNNSNRLDQYLDIVRDDLTGTVNGDQVTFTLASDSTGRTFNVSIVAKGKTTTNSFDRHQHTALLPDLDPAAYLEMAHFALEHPPTAWIVVPKQNGVLVPADYQPQPDASGIFHGQPITMHHTSVLVSSQNGISVEIYYTSQGDLLEADLPEQDFYVIRDGFVLKNRPQYKPPKGSAPPPQQQQGYPQSAYPQQPQG